MFIAFKNQIKILKNQIMKGKYITTKVLLACLSTARVQKKDIHTELRQTIIEHKRIMQQLKEILSLEDDDSYMMSDKKAA